MSISIVIADDENLVRKLFVSELSRYKDINIVGQASNGQELLQEIERCNPDVVLADIIMPGMSGIEALAIARAKSLKVRMIFISMLDSEPVILNAFKEGAYGFLCKTQDGEEIYKAVKTVAKGSFYFTQRISRILLDRAVGRVDKIDKSYKLAFTFSETELDIIKSMNEGMSSAEIAVKIYRSTSTVNRVRQELLHKVGVKNTHGLISFCVKNGFLN